MSIVKVKCRNCGKEYEKRKAEYNRSVRLGRKFYCSQNCAGKCSVSHLKPFKGKYNRNLKKGKELDQYSPFRFYIKVCKRRHWEMDIDLPFLKALWEEQKGICPYTKLKMHLPAKMNDYKSTPWTASLDRIDSNKGYIKDNVQFVCLFINFGKNNFQDQDVKTFLKNFQLNKT